MSGSEGLACVLLEELIKVDKRTEERQNNFSLGALKMHVGHNATAQVVLRGRGASSAEAVILGSIFWAAH